MPDVTFGREKRLLTAQAFQAVFGDAQYKVSHPGFLLLARPNQLLNSRLGMVVAKKNIRFSVDRNRVKRVVRDSFRLMQHNLTPIDVVFLVRRGMDKLSSRNQTDLMLEAWKKLHKNLQMTP
jgi:ribonuclease P protein component|tara:strand:- start:15912 stop:16277 length:366 start_codon:yes stop_codon:yes gene_type:complete